MFLGMKKFLIHVTLKDQHISGFDLSVEKFIGKEKNKIFLWSGMT